jgi:hypothetical protein
VNLWFSYHYVVTAVVAGVATVVVVVRVPTDRKNELVDLCDQSNLDNWIY